MADPIDEIVASTPRKRSRSQVLGDKGLPADPHTAHQRIRASRAVRGRNRDTAVLSGTFPGPLVKAFIAIRKRTDSTTARVLKKFVENGIRDYGTEEEKKLAGLKPASPFDELPDRPSKMGYDGGFHYNDDSGIPAQGRPSIITGRFSGSAPTYGPKITGEVVDEAND